MKKYFLLALSGVIAALGPDAIALAQTRSAQTSPQQSLRLTSEALLLAKTDAGLEDRARPLVVAPGGGR